MELLENPAALRMEHGGYVDPPSHLTKKATPPTGLAAELRSVPDYDYSLFRYSNINTPLLFLIAVVAVIVFCLTCWQGPLGLVTPVNGIQNGIPRDYEIRGLNTEGGLRKNHRNLRLANFAIGLVGILIAVFAIRAGLRPGPLKGLLLLAALFFFVLFVTATVAFAIGLAQHPRAYQCEDYRFRNGQVIDTPLNCDDRKQLSIATFTADFVLAILSFLLFVALVFSTTKKNWAWGPGRVSVSKSSNKPKIAYPPPSPFTHIHQTRRLYVWFLLFCVTAALIVAFVLVIKLQEHDTRIVWTDDRNQRVGFFGSNMEYAIKSGWHRINNRFRLALTSTIVGLCVLQWLNMLAWKRRWFAYVLAALMFWAIVGCYIIFGMDVHDINKAKKLPCPNAGVIFRIVEPIQTNAGITGNAVRCSQWNYYATVAMEFLLGFLLIIYFLYEFIFRCLAKWDTYYFYADSEWLRNHSLFVENTDREAYDWKRFTMDTGRDYYYSPTLGISSRTRPRNYIDPDVPLGFPAY
jgi:hypothetical protein